MNKKAFLILILLFFSLTLEIRAQHKTAEYYQFPSLPKSSTMNINLYTVVKLNFNLTVSENVLLDCSKYYPSVSDPFLPNGYPTVILCHGFGQRKESLDSLAQKQAAFGYCVYTYSMRGQGNSGGVSNLISITEAQDLIQFVNYVKHDQPSGLDSSKLMIMGGSQGAIIPYMAACNGMNVKAIISALASPEFASSWIENGSIKMTLLWTLSYPTDTVRYSPLAQSMKNWIYSSSPDKWDSLVTWLPVNRNFLNKVSQNTVPVLLENSWQDMFFNTSGNINSISLLNSPKRYYFGAVVGHGGDSSSTENQWHMNFFNEWFYYWLFGVNNGILTRPKFHYAYTSFPEINKMWSFVHDSSSVWPPTGMSNLKLYFSTNGKLDVTPNNNSNLYSTLNNTVTGGLTMQDAVNMEFTGAQFNSQFQVSQLIFNSNPLTQDLKMIGTPNLNIDYSSNAAISQFNFQIFEVNNVKAKLVTGINYTDRHNTVNLRKSININGLSHAHIFKSGSKIRIIVTNFDNAPDDSVFLGTNPNVLPVLVNGVNKLFLSSISYISLPVQSVSTGIFSNSGQPNVPLEYKLGQNYPNPFNPSTTIEYSVPRNSFVTLKVYDITGKEVATLVNTETSAGNYSLNFNADVYHLSSGIYFYKLTAGNEVAVKKLLLIK
jgi:predicted acyl esterase